MKRQLALLGGTPVRARPFAAQQTFGEEERNAVLEVLDSGVLSKFLGEHDPDFYGGPRVRDAEEAFARRFNVRHAVSTNSATTGLHAAVAAAGIGPGDEVVVSPFTMSASATAILMQNAIPVFADIEDETFGLDPESVRRCITPRTRAIVVVHLFGHPARMGPILQIAEEHRLTVIEDAAQSIGASWNGTFAGAIGDAGVLSLNYHKIIHSGEGGFVLTDNDAIAQRAQLVRNHGECVVEDLGLADIANTMGSNYRMGEMEAAIAAAQLRKLDALLAHRNDLASRLTARLQRLDSFFTPPTVRADSTHAFYVYAVKCDVGRAGVSRRTLAEALRAEGVPFGEGYVRPLYLQPLYQERIAHGAKGCPWTCGHWEGSVSYAPGVCPTAERLHTSDLLLGDVCHDPLTAQDIDDVADAFEKVVESVADLEAWEHERGRTAEDPDRRSGRWRS